MINNDIAALFDLDGVIIDSETCYTGFWNGIEKLYPTGIPDYAMAIKGTTLPTILNHYADESVREDIVARLAVFQNDMKYELYDGAEDFLRELRDSGIKVALVTSSDPRKMKALFGQLPRLADYFDAVVDASLVTRSKPDPEPYLIGARLLGMAAERCVVFEDSMQGLQAGRSSGARVVGVATTYGRERVGTLADLVVDTIAEMSVARMSELFVE